MTQQQNHQHDSFQELARTQRILEERNRQLALISQIGTRLTSELSLEKVVQQVTDLATEVSGAQFGALFYRSTGEAGEEHTLFTLSGADRNAFTGMHTLRNTPLLAPTFRGEGPIRSDDITQDPRYGHNPPHRGMPEGHPFVRSYLALPVVSKSGEVLGGLFFGHPERGIFTQYEEDLLLGVAAQAAVAIDNARLFESQQAAERRTKLVLESLPQLAWTARADGYAEYFNQRWYAYTGLSGPESRAEGWGRVLHPDDLAPTLTRWRAALDSGDVFEIENRLLRAADNTYRWHLIRATAIKDEQGKGVFWVGSCTDIHDFKQIQERLQQKNEKLLRVNGDLDSFVYRASHDLKAPVLNICQLIHELHRHATFLSPKADLMKGMLDKSLAQLQGTIQDLSEIVKAHRSETAVEQVGLAGIIEEVVTSLNVAVEETGTVLCPDLAPAPALWFNRGNLKSILFNLISNSIKYRATGRSPRITIESRLTPEQVHLRVSDNGMGMDLARQGHRLFQMFSRLHGHVPGSGIGLYIVQRLLRNHGGDIQVQSTPGEGTAFDLSFPRPPGG